MSLLVKTPCDENVIRTRPGGRACERRAEPWILAATVLGSSMAFIDGSVVNVALPVIQTDLKVSVAQAQWVVESYALLLASLVLTAGSMGDRYGRRRIFEIGILVFAAASAWCGLAPSPGQLIAARALQGIGAALLIPNSLAIIGASFAPERRGRAIGTWSAFSAMTMALGPVLGGWLVEEISWRAVFFINLPLAAVVIAILRWRVPESRRGDAVRMDWPGSILAVLGLGGVTYGLIESSVNGITHGPVLAALAAGLLSLAGFLAVERRSRNPMMPPGLFRSGVFSGINLLTFLLYGALSGVFFFLPFNLLQVQGYSATAAGFSLFPFSLLLFLLSRWSGGMADRWGARLPLVVGPVISAVGAALLARPGLGGSYWSTFFPGIAVLGLGMAVTVAPLTTTVLGAVSTERAGVASGVNNAVARVAGLLAIALLGIFMLGLFGRALTRNLSEIEVAESVRREVLAQQALLAAITPNPGLDSAAAASVRGAVERAFVSAFRGVMLVCSAAALAGAGVAVCTIPARTASTPTRSAPVGEALPKGAAGPASTPAGSASGPRSRSRR